MELVVLHFYAFRPWLERVKVDKQNIITLIYWMDT